MKHIKPALTPTQHAAISTSYSTSLILDPTAAWAPVRGVDALAGFRLRVCPDDGDAPQLSQSARWRPVGLLCRGQIAVVVESIFKGIRQRDPSTTRHPSV